MAPTKTHEELASAFGLISEAEFLALTGLAASTAKSWRNQGKGPKHVLLGTAVAYPVDGVRQWIDEQIKSRNPSTKGPASRAHLL